MVIKILKTINILIIKIKIRRKAIIFLEKQLILIIMNINKHNNSQIFFTKIIRNQENNP
jgi:hypothetical protein